MKRSVGREGTAEKPEKSPSLGLVLKRNGRRAPSRAPSVSGWPCHPRLCHPRRGETFSVTPAWTLQTLSLSPRDPLLCRPRGSGHLQTLRTRRAGILVPGWTPRLAGPRPPRTKNRDLGTRAPPRPPKAQPGRGARSARRPGWASHTLRSPRVPHRMAAGPSDATLRGSGRDSRSPRPAVCRPFAGRPLSFSEWFPVRVSSSGFHAALGGRRPSSNAFFPHSFLPSLLLHLPLPCPQQGPRRTPSSDQAEGAAQRPPSRFACT